MRTHVTSMGIFFVGLFLVLGGIAFAFYDFGTGDTSSRGGKFSIVCIFASYFGAFLLINLKVSNREKAFALALAYPFFIFLCLYLYAEYYLFPKIDNEGLLTTGIVTNKDKKVSGDAVLKMTANYEYKVNNEKYFKYTFEKRLEVGDTLFIKYLEVNPNYHKYYMVKPD